VAGGGDGDVEDAFGAGVGFFEGQVADVGADAGFEDGDVEEVAFADETRDPAGEGLEEAILVFWEQWLLVWRFHPSAASSEGCQVNAIPVEEVEKLILGMDAHESRYQCSCSSASDYSRQQSSEMQCLDDTQMAESKHSASLQYQRRSPKSLSCIVQQIELRLRCPSLLVVGRRGQRRNILDCQRNLRDVFFDQ